MALNKVRTSLTVSLSATASVRRQRRRRQHE